MLRIGQVAESAGVSVDTVRYYERRGVLPPPARLPSGYRSYSPATIDRIVFARRLQQLGLSLQEIVEVLRSHDEGGATCESERWRLDQVIGRLDRQLAELASLREVVATALASCEAGDCDLTGEPIPEG